MATTKTTTKAEVTTTKRNDRTTSSTAVVVTPSPAYVAARGARASETGRVRDIDARLSRARATFTAVREREAAGDLELSALEILAAEAEIPRLEAAREAAKRRVIEARAAEAPHAAQHAAELARETLSATDLRDAKASAIEAAVKAAMPVLTAALAGIDATVTAQRLAVAEVTASLRDSDAEDYRRNHNNYVHTVENLERNRTRLEWAPDRERAEIRERVTNGEEAVAELEPYASPLAGDARLTKSGVIIDGVTHTLPTTTGVRRDLIRELADALATALEAGA